MTAICTPSATTCLTKVLVLYTLYSADSLGALQPSMQCVPGAIRVEAW